MQDKCFRVREKSELGRALDQVWNGYFVWF